MQADLINKYTKNVRLQSVCVKVPICSHFLCHKIWCSCGMVCWIFRFSGMCYCVIGRAWVSVEALYQHRLDGSTVFTSVSKPVTLPVARWCGCGDGTVFYGFFMSIHHWTIRHQIATSVAAVERCVPCFLYIVVYGHRSDPRKTSAKWEFPRRMLPDSRMSQFIETGSWMLAAFMVVNWGIWELPRMNTHVIEVSYFDICQWTENLFVNFHLSPEVKWLSKWYLGCPGN